MNIKKFNEIVKTQLERSERLLTGKGREYAEGAEESEEVDRLAHFKKAAALQNTTPKRAAFGMLAKHLVSVSDMVASEGRYRTARWEEKLTDSINYLLILRALIEEENSTRVFAVQEEAANE